MAQNSNLLISDSTFRTLDVEPDPSPSVRLDPSSGVRLDRNSTLGDTIGAAQIKQKTEIQTDLFSTLSAQGLDGKANLISTTDLLNNELPVTRVWEIDAEPAVLVKIEPLEPMQLYHPLDPTPPNTCLLYTSPSPRDQRGSRMPSSA